MVDTKISPILRATINNFTSAVKMLPKNFTYKHYEAEQYDEFVNSGNEPLSTDARLNAAVKKFNAANELKIVAETNYFAELYHNYKLLQEYQAYKNPLLDDLTFAPISDDTVSATYKKKHVEISSKVIENGNKQYEISFEDGSKINYIVFSNGGTTNINGEEFEMPIGTILETKSVNGRVFSKLIQTPDMRRNVINMPEVFGKADQILITHSMSKQPAPDNNTDKNV